MEDPDATPPKVSFVSSLLVRFNMLIVWKTLWNLTKDPEDAPSEPLHFSLSFEKGIPSKLVVGEETITDSLALFKRLNEIGFEHGKRPRLRKHNTSRWSDPVSPISRIGIVVPVPCPRTLLINHIVADIA